MLPTFELSNEHLSWTLVPMTESHTEAINKVINQNKGFIHEWTPFIKTEMDETRTFTRRVAQCHQDFLDGKPYSILNFVIVVNQEEVVGVVGLLRFDHSLKRAEIGYWIAEKVSGQGVVTMSSKVIMEQVGFKLCRLSTVELHCVAHHEKSKGVALRLKPDRFSMSEKPEIELKQVMYHKMVYEFDNPDLQSS